MPESHSKTKSNKPPFTVKRKKWKDGHYHVVARDLKGHFIATRKWHSKADTQHIYYIATERHRPPPPPPPPPPPTPTTTTTTTDFEKERPSEKIGKSGFRYKITVKIILNRTVSLKRGERLDYYYMSLTSNSKQLSWSQRQRIEEYVRSRKENIYKDARIVEIRIVRIIDRETGEKWLYE